MTEPNPGDAAAQNATTPQSAQPASKPPRKGWITPTLGAIAAIAIGLVSGILIGQHTGGSTQAFGPRAGQFTQQGGAGADFTSGTIVSVKDGTLVVKTKDGSQKNVTVADDTKVTTTSDASLSDLAAGDTVTVIGRAGSDGGIAASSIAEGDVGFGGIRPVPARAN